MRGVREQHTCGCSRLTATARVSGAVNRVPVVALAVRVILRQASRPADVFAVISAVDIKALEAYAEVGQRRTVPTGLAYGVCKGSSDKQYSKFPGARNGRFGTRTILIDFGGWPRPMCDSF